MSEQAAGSSGFLGGLTGLQKIALVFAAIVSMSGAGMWGVAATTGSERGEQASENSGGEGSGPEFEVESFTDSGSGGGDEGESESGEDDADKTALEVYSPTVFRLGFAFFLGFAVAYALRAAFKIVLIVVGTVLLLLIGLQMAGLITVNWGAMEDIYDTSTAWLATQTQSLTAFLSGYIPSGGTAVAGFGIGMLKKH